VSVCFKGVLARVEEAAHEGITAVFHVHHLDVLSVEDGHTEFKFFWWFGLHIVDGLEFFFRHLRVVDLDPHADLSLRQVHTRMEDFTSFSRLVLEGVPLGEEIAILQVQLSSSN